MPKAAKNVDKGCTFSSLVSRYDHLYEMNDKSFKKSLVCGTANSIRSHCLLGLLSQES